MGSLFHLVCKKIKNNLLPKAEREKDMNKTKTVTITKDQFREAVNNSIEKLSKKEPEIAIPLLLTGILLGIGISDELFGKEEDKKEE